MKTSLYISDLLSYVDKRLDDVAHEKARVACAVAASKCGTSLSESSEFKAAMEVARPKIKAQLVEALEAKAKAAIDAWIKELDQ